MTEVAKTDKIAKKYWLLKLQNGQLVRIFRIFSKLHFQDGGHEVISRRKVLPSDECIRSVCPYIQSDLYRKSVVSSFLKIFDVFKM